MALFKSRHYHAVCLKMPDLPPLRSLTEISHTSACRGEEAVLSQSTPQSSAYLLKSFPIHNDTTRSTNVSLKQSASASASPAEKERCLSLLLRAIDLLCESWASTLLDQGRIGQACMDLVFTR